MLSLIVREVKIIVADKYLLTLCGTTCIGFAAIFNLQMYLLEDQAAGYKALGALAMGISMILASYIDNSAASVLTIRYWILTVGFAALITINLKTDGIDLISWVWR